MIIFIAFYVVVKCADIHQISENYLQIYLEPFSVA